MGKKKSPSKASSGICKNINEKDKFNGLVKVLRPKVYITDSSNFKRLVQELTGNKPNTTDPFLASSKIETYEQSPVLDFEIQGDQQENSMEAVSFEASIESLSSWNQVVLNEEINQTWNQIYEDAKAFDSSSNKQMEWPTVWELESWLLDIDGHHQPFSFDNGFPQIVSLPGSPASLDQYLPNPILDSFSCAYNNL